MTSLKKIFFLLIIYFSFINSSFSNIDLKIVLKINNEIVTTYDIEQEKNYLLALNPKLREIDEIQLTKIAKKSLTKEIIRKIEVLKYKELKLENPQIENVLDNLIRNLDFQNENEFKKYLSNYEISIKDLKKKIEIENEWKNMIYSKYQNSVNVDKEKLILKINNSNEGNFIFEYNLSEIIFTIKNNSSYENDLKKIEDSIKNNGFENTANLFSISDSSNVGGKIGWVAKKNLSIQITNALENLRVNEHSAPIKLGNNILLLKINETRKRPNKINKKAELDKMIFIETSKQLEKFSNIFYNKIKLNAKISEF